MPDVLSSGREPAVGGPPARPPRRWRGPLAAVLVAAVAGVLAVRSAGTGEGPRPAPSLSVLLQPPPTPLRTGPPLPDATYRLAGDPGTGPAGLRLLVGGRHPGVLDAGTGRLTDLSALLGHPRDVVVDVDHRAGLTTVVIANPERQHSRGVLLGRSGPVDLGPALQLLPLRDGTVLAESCTAGTRTGPCLLAARDATGRTRWRRTVPRQLELVRDTPYGLLVRAYQGDLGGVARLEDPRTGQVRKVLTSTYAVLAADDRQMVFVPAGCDSDCGLVHTDLAGLSSQYLPANPGRPVAAAFSPDGRRLAIGFAGLFGADPSPSPERDGYAVVVALSGDNHIDLVPDVATGPNSAPLPVWVTDRQLVLAVSDGVDGRVVSWAPGAARLTVLPTRLPGLPGRPGMVVPVG